MEENAFITEPERKTPVITRADVIVVGGGPAGAGAALRASRSGADTLLLERFGNLGGINTTGLMSITYEVEHLAGEIFARLRSGGYVVDLLERYPAIASNPLVHYTRAMDKRASKSLIAWDPDVLSCTIFDILEESGVRLMLNTLFVEAIVKNGGIEAVIVENASGRQAIQGKVIIDATGRGDVAAQAGASFVSAANELGAPMPAGLMWRMSGVDLRKLFEYQEKDPTLDKIIEQARNRDQISYYSPKKTEKEMKNYDSIYTGHPAPELCPSLYPGEILLWAPAPYDWRLNPAENAEDLTRAETVIRKQIMEELGFLKRYVPGFEKAHIAGIAPLMGIREGRHSTGEYVITYEDVAGGVNFPDAVLRFKTNDHLNLRDRELPGTEFDVPLRAFLPKGVDNLLLSGDHISAEHAAFIHLRGFGKAMSSGEVAGIISGLSVKDGANPGELAYSQVREQLVKHGLLSAVG